MTTGGAPPRIDGDWKHWIFSLFEALGFPPDLMWISLGIVAFFVGRVMVADRTKDLRTQMESVKSIVQVDALIAGSKSAGIAWALLLLPQTRTNVDTLRLTGEMLGIGGGLVRLHLWQRTWQATGFGLVICVTALAMWLVGHYVLPETWWFEFVCIGIAWLPAALLAFFWWRGGELQRLRDRYEEELCGRQDDF